MITIIDIRFEHHNPGLALGIGESTPRISWSFSGCEQDWFQRSCEIEITRDGLRNIFVTYTCASVLISWPDRPLSSGDCAIIRVRATSTTDEVTPWSEPCGVEAGLLRKEDWLCSLIESSSTEATSTPHRPLIFRKEFKQPSPVLRARLYITAHGIYEARINGRKVGDHVLSPGWTSYKHRLIYQTLDVGDYLLPGCISIEVEVAEGWYCGRLGFNGGEFNIYGDRLGVIALLVVDCKSGQRLVIGSDDSWQTTSSATMSAGIYDGETYDQNQEEGVVWEAVVCRAIEDNLVELDGAPIRKTGEIKAQRIFQSPSGKLLVDFGQNMVGWVRIAARGPAGTRIQLRHAEVLEDGELGTRPLRTAKATDVLTLAGNRPILWEPKFTYHGFRYVEVDGWSGELRAEDLVGIVVHTDMRRTGHFECSNFLLNKLHGNIVWSMRGNFLGIPTDCPQRDERMAWTGDINVFADTANFIYDTSGMLSSWLRDVAAEQLLTKGGGIVPLTVPNIIEFFSRDAHAIWGDVAVMLPWSLYQAFGDVKVLKDQYSSMRAWIKCIPRRENGLWNYLSIWKLGDWLDPAAPPDDAGNAMTDPEMVSNFYFIHITDIMTQTAKTLGHSDDAVEFETQAKALRAAFCYEYMTPSGLLAADTQTAFALAILFDLFPTEDQQQHAAERLSLIISRNNHFSIATGFAGTPFLGHALTKVNMSNIFYRMLLHRQNPSWLYPVTMGATTMWERWDSMLPDGSINPGEMTSFNHYALGAVADWMHINILGLKSIEPGWRAFKIEPTPGGGLKWAKGKFLSAYGECSVKWKIKENEHPDGGPLFYLRAGVPPNTSAQIKLPGKEEVFKVGSGWHEFEVPYEQPEWPPEVINTINLVSYEKLPDDGQLPWPEDEDP